MRMMMCMIKSYKQLMKLYKVERYRACATSAMRDARNGQKILKKIKKETGIDIEILAGSEEARILYNNSIETADVIIPASEIFLVVANSLNCTEINVPNISLADGIIDGIYRSERCKVVDD